MNFFLLPFAVVSYCSFRPGQILATLLSEWLHWNKWYIQGINVDSWSSPIAKCLKIKWMKFWTSHLSETHFYFNFVKDRLDYSLVWCFESKQMCCSVSIWHLRNPASQWRSFCVCWGLGVSYWCSFLFCFCSFNSVLLE